MTKRITLNEDMAEIMARIATRTGMTISVITNHLLGSHLPELHELDAFLEVHPSGAGSLREQGVNLMQSYGPESIMEGIARIAPHYQTLAARIEREMDEAIGSTATGRQ
jgi:hypothetical protein